EMIEEKLRSDMNGEKGREKVFSTWMTFGGNTRNLGSFGEEIDKITDLHQDSPRIMFSEYEDGIRSTKQRNHDLFGDGVRDLATILLLLLLVDEYARKALENQLLSVSLLTHLGKHECIERISSGDENPICTLGDYSKPSHEGYTNTIKIPVWNNMVSLRSDTIWLVQNGCSFHGLRSEDPNQHLKDFLKLVDSLDLDGENRERTCLGLFQFSLRDQASNWLDVPARSITT
ncbi:hypothetical protein Tco_0721070, partial [Tanacetum coccineum]